MIRKIASLSGRGDHVIHLGLRKMVDTEWASLPGIQCLDELFQIDESLSSLRSTQVERARGACRRKALLRELGGGSTSIAHGWEDLAAFKS